MKRKYVHLSKTREEALQVGRRKSKNPIVFTVEAKRAYEQGITFYHIGLVVLTEVVPAGFVQSADE
ncbi:MAG: RNA 2'-phosphotransferase [Candidatus Zixiibacteriota bacterium]